MPSELQLRSVVSPGNNDKIVVTRGSPPANVNLGEGDALQDGDLLNGAADASADVARVDTGTNEIEAVVVSFESAEPTTIEVNWDEVIQVDEYYDPPAYQYDITTDLGFTGIRG